MLIFAFPAILLKTEVANRKRPLVFSTRGRYLRGSTSSLSFSRKKNLYESVVSSRQKQKSPLAARAKGRNHVVPPFFIAVSQRAISTGQSDLRYNGLSRINLLDSADRLKDVVHKSLLPLLTYQRLSENK